MNNKELLNRELASIIRFCTDVITLSTEEVELEQITKEDLQQCEEIKKTILKLERKITIELPF